MKEKEYVPDKTENAFVLTKAGVKFYVRGVIRTIYTKEAAEKMLQKEFGKSAVEDLNKYGHFNWINL